MAAWKSRDIILTFNHLWINFIQKIILKKLLRSVEVKLEFKFGYPKNEAYFTIFNFCNFVIFKTFFLGGAAKRDFAHNKEKSWDGTDCEFCLLRDVISVLIFRVKSWLCSLKRVSLNKSRNAGKVKLCNSASVT